MNKIRTEFTLLNTKRLVLIVVLTFNPAKLNR